MSAATQGGGLRSRHLNRRGFVGGVDIDRAMTMDSPQTAAISPDIREHVVRMVRQHQGEHTIQWGAISSITAKICCASQTLHGRMRQAERNGADWAGATSATASGRLWVAKARLLNLALPKGVSVQAEPLRCLQAAHWKPLGDWR